MFYWNFSKRDQKRETAHPSYARVHPSTKTHSSQKKERRSATAVLISSTGISSSCMSCLRFLFSIKKKIPGLCFKGCPACFFSHLPFTLWDRGQKMTRVFNPPLLLFLSLSKEKQSGIQPLPVSVASHPQEKERNLMLFVIVLVKRILRFEMFTTFRAFYQPCFGSQLF